MNHIEKNKQRRDWLNWYGKTMNIMDLTAQANKFKYKEKLAKFDWVERYKAKAFGFDIGPELLGDVMLIANMIVDDFGDLIKPKVWCATGYDYGLDFYDKEKK